jgi:hypothetical protein
VLSVERLEQVYAEAARLGDDPLRRWARDLLFPHRYGRAFTPLTVAQCRSYERQAEAATRAEAAYLRCMMAEGRL